MTPSRRVSLTVDVRDMVCAQALAVVAQALAKLRLGETAEILYNAEDVKRDLLSWARDRHYPACETVVDLLAIRRA